VLTREHCIPPEDSFGGAMLRRLSTPSNFEPSRAADLEFLA
jgi:hypothetical protein